MKSRVNWTRKIWRAISARKTTAKEKRNVRRVSGNLPPDPTRKARLAAEFARPESAIDFSDIPETDAAFLVSAVRAASVKPKKKQTTIKLDEDVIDWFKTGGKGCQSRMNSILRAVMLRNARA
ncbi:MAG: BrnA antitoxin family protein [Candidatus Accumulibacter sp.]|nr:BrnA antitoxin family protein [Accumulibacter sp.]